MRFSGRLTNQRNEEIVQFKPDKFGIGQFSFTPATGDVYTATVVTEDGKTINRELPAIYEQGYVMQLQDGGNGQLQVSVRSNMPSRAPAEEVFLFAHSHQEVKAAIKKAIVNGIAQFTIDKNKLGRVFPSSRYSMNKSNRYVNACILNH
ncbi:hypothetical protein [Paraflavitalea speifideaquila]|uniref:hypothetical protein n=1 Tax=Paraflavitalea speifideaquila TaxID=3076558 RepID=UPI0028E51030|nr:hypothetical protein [Paraflavitalea speifideiaquila]